MFSFAQELVDRIKKNGGRFLGKCDGGLWYVMKDDDARRKAIQGKILLCFQRLYERWKN
jgi:hypothetical protein